MKKVLSVKIRPNVIFPRLLIATGGDFYNFPSSCFYLLESPGDISPLNRLLLPLLLLEHIASESTKPYSYFARQFSQEMLLT